MKVFRRITKPWDIIIIVFLSVLSLVPFFIFSYTLAEKTQEDSINVAVISVGNLEIQRITLDRKSTRLNSSHVAISYAVFCLKKKKNIQKIHIEPFGSNHPILIIVQLKNFKKDVNDTDEAFFNAE